MVYAIISFDFSDPALRESFKDLLRDCGAQHEKNDNTFALEEFATFDFMIKSVEEWKEVNDFDYIDYVRVYFPSGGNIGVEDLV